MGQYYEAGFLIFVEKSVSKINIPGFSILIIIMNIFLALRLYLHAWILDESKNLQKAKKSISKRRKFFEWFLRLSWVAGMSWLPSAYDVFPKKILFINFHIHHYILLILLILLIWDLLMKSAINKHTNQNVQDLKEIWLQFDFIMLICIFVTCIFIRPEPLNEFYNWLIILIPLSYFSICIISAVQFFYWFPSIIRSAKISLI